MENVEGDRNNMNKETEKEMLSTYHKLFDEKSKALAFEEIAKRYYAGNFGQMSKADFETLLFHLYIEQILKTDDQAFSEYSDYRLSKQLGISQSKVSSLKIKKQLQYPHSFSWKNSLEALSNRVNYENGKIKIQIPDINLYLEIKNAVEEMGGYVEVSLTPKLLQLSPGYFLDLLVQTEKDEKKESLRKDLAKELRDCCREKNKDTDFFDAEPFGKQMAQLGKEMSAEIVSTLLGNALSGGLLGNGVVKIIRSVVTAINASFHNS